MDAGQLDRRVTLERATEADDGYATSVSGWQPIASVWAKLVPISGAEMIAAGETAAFNRIRLKIRRDSQWSDLNATDRLTFDDTAIGPIFRNHVHVYGAFEGPTIERTVGPETIRLRLFVRDGHPGYEQELAPDPQVGYTRIPRPLGRRSFLHTWLKMVIPSAYVREGDRIAMDSETAP